MWIWLHSTGYAVFVFVFFLCRCKNYAGKKCVADHRSGVWEICKLDPPINLLFLWTFNYELTYIYYFKSDYSGCHSPSGIYAPQRPSIKQGMQLCMQIDMLLTNWTLTKTSCWCSEYLVVLYKCKLSLFRIFVLVLDLWCENQILRSLKEKNFFHKRSDRTEITLESCEIFKRVMSPAYWIGC